MRILTFNLHSAAAASLLLGACANHGVPPQAATGPAAEPASPGVSTQDCSFTLVPDGCRAVSAISAHATREYKPEYAAAMAIDRNRCTHWNAGAFAPQSIDLELSAVVDVSALYFVSESGPDGKATVEIATSTDGTSFVPVQVSDAFLKSNEPLMIPLTKVVSAKFIRITTLKSHVNSWIAWREIVPLICP